MARRVHSTIDRLPVAVRRTAMRMIVDGDWPDGVQGEGKPTYEDVVAWLTSRGHRVSLSAMGRWAKQLLALSRMRQSAEIVREVMADVKAERVSETQRAVAELITATAIDTLSSVEELTPRQLRDVSSAMRDCTTVAINADKYIRQQLDARAKAADQQITALARKRKLDPEVLKAIREQVYGIVT